MTQTETQARCSASVRDRDGWHSYQCSRKAKIERGGKAYCTQHDPEQVKVRRDKFFAKLDARNAASSKVYRRQAAEHMACEGVPTEWLESGGLQQLVKAARWYRHVVVGDGQSLREAQEAFEKALPYERADETCGTCHGEVGHRINCPEGIAFSKDAPSIAQPKH